MPRVIVMCLNTAMRSALGIIVARGQNWRERQRAQTLLYFDSGMSAVEVAQLLDVHVGTVLRTRRKWFEAGLECLSDLPRSGAPRKISEQQTQRLVALASEQPMSAKQLLAKHVESGGGAVHLNTLTAALHKADLVWKRTRHSLKKKRNELAFRTAQAEIEQLRIQAAAGEIVLAYADEAGFSPIHPNRSAWTPVGQRHLIEAKRGKQLNVMAALLSTGEVFSAKYWETTTADIFGGFLGLLTQHVGKPIKLIIDNASIHRAKALKPVIKHLEMQGLTIYFLPPYSPELNKIERLWHKIKHTWMTPKYRDSKTLEADVEEIFDNFGSKYCFAF